MPSGRDPDPYGQGASSSKTRAAFFENAFRIAYPAAAAIGVAVTTLAYLRAFTAITDVVGGTARLVAVVAVAAVCGAALARVVPPRTAVRLAVALFLAGLFAYYLTIPGSRVALGSLGAIVLDVVSLLTGLSVLRLVLVDV
ncbi:MAG: transglutaminase, partial [Natrialbaceae archaeon]